MLQRKLVLYVLTLIGTLSFLSACSSNKTQDLEIEGYVNSGSTINPDINDEARPINLTLYYLADPEAFDTAGFFDLFSNAEKILGDNLLKVTKLQAQPGQKQTLDLEAPQDTKAVGVVAAFRDVDESQWGAYMLTPDKCFIRCKPGLKGESIVIDIKRLSVNIDFSDYRIKKAAEKAEDKRKAKARKKAKKEAEAKAKQAQEIKKVCSNNRKSC